MPDEEHMCPVCSGRDIVVIFEMQDIPVQCNVLHATRESALRVPRGTMQLGFCKTCGHLYNYAFDADTMSYTSSYENSLHFSPLFQAYARGLAQDLIARHELHNKTIVEVGCGTGEFLRMLCDMGGNTGIGFDRSYRPDAEEEHSPRFRVIRDFYSDAYTHLRPDFLCCRHVLEHIHAPVAFVTGIRDSLAVQKHCSLYFEVPNALYTLKQLGIWDLIYEHCSYFTISSMTALFRTNGFIVERCDEKYDGQFLGIELRLPGSPLDADTISTPELPALAMSFGENYAGKVATWRERFGRMRSDGKRVVIWGSGSKGVTFLNTLRPDIPYIVDINPRKHGMYAAGSGQQIVPPEFLLHYNPDTVIIMNAIYANEIRISLDRLGLHPDIIAA